jgi:hypothetical protein
MEQRTAGRQRSLTELLLLSLTLRLPVSLTEHFVAVVERRKRDFAVREHRLDHIEAMFAFFILLISQAMVAPLSTF